MDTTAKRKFVMGSISGITGNSTEDFELYAVSAAMLFPNDERRQKEYLCLAIDEMYSRRLDDQSEDQDTVRKAFGDAIVSVFLEEIAEEAAPSKIKIMPGPGAGVAHRKYQATLQAARFSAEKKGPIRERMWRGFLAGVMLTGALLENMSLADASRRIEEKASPDIRKERPEFFEDMPTITADNLQQNVWPEFKDAAHLWAALRDFVPDSYSPDKYGLIDLSCLAELGNIMVLKDDGTMENISLTSWPSQHFGWKAFLWKANHIFECALKLGNRKYVRKPLLDPDTCWRFLL